MNQNLNLFYQNQGERMAVKTFMLDVLREMAADKAFVGEDISGIKDAKDCVDKMFAKLEEQYGKVEVKEFPNPR